MSFGLKKGRIVSGSYLDVRISHAWRVIILRHPFFYLAVWYGYDRPDGVAGLSRLGNLAARGKRE